MRYVCLNIFLLFFISGKGPVFSPRDESADYGTIAYASDGFIEYPFTNNGDEPLIIISVWSSCGCLVPYWPKDPVLSGKSDKIGLRYDTRRAGPFNKMIYIRSNEAEPNNQRDVKVHGYVLAPDSLAPKNH